MNQKLIKNDKDIVLTIALKYNQLKRNALENLEVKQFVDYLFKHLWRNKTPESVSAAVVEIMQADADNIVAYLSKNAVLDAKHNNLSDYNDLFRQDLSK